VKIMDCKKELSNIIGTEVFIQPNYAIAKFMKSGILVKTAQNQKMFFTFKPIKEIDLPEQIQMHIRFDSVNNDVLDIDVYIPVAEFLKLKDMKIIREEAIL
jgi:hypothetical protein